MATCDQGHRFVTPRPALFDVCADCGQAYGKALVDLAVIKPRALDAREPDRPLTD